MKSGETGQAGTPPPISCVPLNSRGTPGRPKSRALIESLKVHAHWRQSREATRTP
jgi:hypothetical protein